jgi:hypothetical protein
MFSRGGLAPSSQTKGSLLIPPGLQKENDLSIDLTKSKKLTSSGITYIFRVIWQVIEAASHWSSKSSKIFTCRFNVHTVRWQLIFSINALKTCASLLVFVRILKLQLESPWLYQKQTYPTSKLRAVANQPWHCRVQDVRAQNLTIQPGNISIGNLSWQPNLLAGLT